MTGATFLQSLATLVAYEEVSEYGTNAELAVLFCFRNRVAAGWEDGDFSRILQRYFFEMYSSGSTIYIPDIPDVRNPDFQQVLGYVEGIFDNSLQDKLTSGALYWGVNKPIGAKERVAQVGPLLLWK